MKDDYLMDAMMDGDRRTVERAMVKIMKSQWPENILEQVDNFAWILIGVAIAVLCDWLKVPEAIWGAATGICLNKARSSNGTDKPKE